MNMSITIVTWNVLADIYIKPERYRSVPADALDPTRRRRLMCAQAVAMGADVLLLQEVEPAAYDALAQALGEGYEGTLALKSGRAEGSAVFTRRGLVEVERAHTHVYAAQGDGRGTLALMARLSVGGRALGVASTHLEWSPRGTSPAAYTGLAQMRELLDARSELLPEGAAWVLGGDMNAISQSAPIEEAMARGLKLGCRAQRPWDTVNINRRRRKIDYLLYTPGHLEAAPGVLPRLTPDEPMPSLERASDHLPVQVAFTWR
jgi:endonuclease/exonuclease/phosphatase family metal-dependent hydrolase